MGVGVGVWWKMSHQPCKVSELDSKVNIEKCPSIRKMALPAGMRMKEGLEPDILGQSAV